MSKAKVRHILVHDAFICEEFKDDILNGADFAEIARDFSECPSGQDGGFLGEFSPGQMVPEFDDVCFNDEVGVLHGPVETEFGFHLIEILERTD